MKRINLPKFKHVKGINEVITKLQKVEQSIINRSAQLLFYITAMVHYDFIHKIVKDELKDDNTFALAPNSIMYLLDYKWEAVGHDVLFILTGGYVRSIRILNITNISEVSSDKKKVLTAIVGVNDGYHEGIAKILEIGGKTKLGYIPARPLWTKYKTLLAQNMSQQDFKEFESSPYSNQVDVFVKNFEKLILDDISKNNKILDISSYVSDEQKYIESFIAANDPKNTLSKGDFISMVKGSVGDYSDEMQQLINQKIDSISKNTGGKSNPDVITPVMYSEIEQDDISSDDKDDTGSLK